MLKILNICNTWTPIKHYHVVYVEASSSSWNFWTPVFIFFADLDLDLDIKVFASPFLSLTLHAPYERGCVKLYVQLHALEFHMKLFLANFWDVSSLRNTNYYCAKE